MVTLALAWFCSRDPAGRLDHWKAPFVHVQVCWKGVFIMLALFLQGLKRTLVFLDRLRCDGIGLFAYRFAVTWFAARASLLLNGRKRCTISLLTRAALQQTPNTPVWIHQRRELGMSALLFQRKRSCTQVQQGQTLFAEHGESWHR